MKKRSRVVIISLITLFLIMHFAFGSSRKGRDANLFERAIAFVCQPVAEGFSSITGFFSHSIEEYFFLVNAKKENKNLKETLQNLKLENQSLKKVLDWKKKVQADQKKYAYLGYQLQPVKVIGYDPFSPSKTLWIDAGIRTGIQPNTILVSADGLVGRVIQVHDKTAQVLLLIDGMYAVDTVNQRTRLRCMVKGLNSESLKAQRLPFLSQIEYKQKGHDVIKDDILITSGMGGLYPEGIPVGQVAKVDFDQSGYFEKSLVMPAVDFMKLHHVYALMPSASQKQISSLPKEP